MRNFGAQLRTLDLALLRSHSLFLCDVNNLQRRSSLLSVEFMDISLYLVTGATNDGRKHGARCVIAGEPSLHQAGAVITHQGGGLFVVAHGVGSEKHTGLRAHTHARKWHC